VTWPDREWLYRPVARRARVLRDQQGSDQPQALRRHLVRVTQRLLAAHGLTGLTTRGIAREAEVSDGVLYNYFADKDELVVAALAEQMAELSARFRARVPVAGQQDLRTGLLLLVRLCIGFQAEALPVLSGLISRPELFHRLIEQVHTGDQAAQLIWARIVDYLHAECELGNVTTEIDTHAVTHVLFGAAQLQVLAGMMSGSLGPAEVLHGARTLDDDALGPLVTLLFRACRP